MAPVPGTSRHDPGAVKNTYGTGCFMFINTTSETVRSDHGLLTTIARRMGGGAIEGLGRVYIVPASIGLDR